MMIHCKVLMNSSDKTAELTGKQDIEWSDCIIDISIIHAVRRSIEDEHGNSDLAVVHFDGDYWILDIKYDDFIAEYFQLNKL